MRLRSYELNVPGPQPSYGDWGQSLRGYVPETPRYLLRLEIEVDDKELSKIIAMMRGMGAEPPSVLPVPALESHFDEDEQ